MFELDGFANPRRIKWKNLQPGMLIISGITINDIVPEELRDFPVLTPELLHQLFTKYSLLGERDIVVADTIHGFPQKQISRSLLESKEKIDRLNIFRKNIIEDKKQILKSLGIDEDIDIPIINSEHVVQDEIILDTYNSFSLFYGKSFDFSAVPSFFDRIDLELKLGDLLTNTLNKKFKLPEDKEVLLHIVVDYSYSMENQGKLEMVISALNYFYSYILSFLKNTKIRLYVFSDECISVSYPLHGKEIPRKDTNYGSFIKKVLHFKDKTVHNKILLFTDGQPSDLSETLRLAELIKKNKIDYTQLIFNFQEELRSQVTVSQNTAGITVDGYISQENIDKYNIQSTELDDEALNAKVKDVFSTFTRIAEIAGGNQIIIKINELIKILSIECYDRYVGMLTLATSDEVRAITNETYNTDSVSEKKQVKKWDFKKLEK